MQDPYTVYSTDGDEQQHTRLVIAADKPDAIKTHREHFPGYKVTGVIPNGKRDEDRARRRRFHPPAP